MYRSLVPTLVRGLLALEIAATLLGPAAMARAQDWSPDSRQIAIGGAQLSVVRVAPAQAGAPRQAPTPTTNQCSNPTWSPDGKTIAFIAADNHVVLLDLLTGKLTTMQANAVTGVTWSPDSKTYAVVTADKRGGLHAGTFYRNGGAALVVDLPFSTMAPADGARIGWIPDTDNLILAGGDATHQDLWLIEQGQPIRLTSTGDVLGFVVTRSGDTITWARRSPNTHYIIFSLYKLNIQDRSLIKIEYPAVLSEVNPTSARSPDAVVSVVFSPDVRRLAFVTIGGPGVTAGGSSLYVSDIAGKVVKLVGRGDAAPNVGSLNLSLPIRPPSFSPSGAAFAFEQFGSNRRSLIDLDLVSGQSTTYQLP